MDIRLLMMGKSPEELRAMAKQLVAMARMQEMAQDPQAYAQKAVNKKVGGMKRKMQYGLARSLKSPK